MTLSTTRIRELLRNFGFQELFIQELGWDHHSSHLSLSVGSQECQLNAVAHKRGMVAYICSFPNGVSLDYPTRCKLETQVAKTVREHLIIFTDESKGLQIWQWVKREQGKPVTRREHVYHTSQAGDSLIQKLENLEVTLEEEEDVDLLDVTTKARKAFDIDKVTKKFYDLFKKNHSTFLKAIDGIPGQEDREWYASIMLNRLMFTYFIQAKGFLDQDKHYLRNRLQMIQEQRRKDKFLSFYRTFLLKLFHDGLGKQKRDAATAKLLGRIPFLNGGVFEVHQLEEKYGEIDIAGKAFETLFDFFDQYEWRLDNRPTRDDREINPDVLGYIFEKYINQKQMGAYYTKEDITEYISKNTIIPYIFDKTRRAMEKKKMADAFAFAFTVLKGDPDRYIYDAVRHGTDLKLPDEIAEGLDAKKPNLLERRKGWNSSAPPEYALPTEIWREVVARRQRCEQTRNKLKKGEVTAINDLITLNLNIRQFAQDVIENCEGPHLLNAFWKAISKITVLDPTCGSGAFLFAALNILEPLYEACLDRMRAFMLEWSEQTKIKHTNYYKDFAAVLARIDEHANERYFIFKTIIINNLYGVDLMEEAVEICKLRLFLKLAAQVEPDYEKDNMAMEPLPDIDFNIRAGNTLVGFATYEDVKRAVTSEFDFENAMEKIEDKAKIVSGAFKQFRKQQTELGGAVSAEDKRALRSRLEELDEELNQYLARQYGVDRAKKAEYKKWCASHQPFHWFVEFYSIVHGHCGFDVIIGNPPYLEYSKVDDYTVRDYRTAKCSNLYAFTVERSLLLLGDYGHTGLIIPISVACSGALEPLREEISRAQRTVWMSHYSNRPGQLFTGAQNRLTIFLASSSVGSGHRFSTQYHRWDAKGGEREAVFQNLRYLDTTKMAPGFHGLYCKAGTPGAAAVLSKGAKGRNLEHFISRHGSNQLYWVRVPGYFCQFQVSPPMARPESGGKPHVRGEVLSVAFDNIESRNLCHAILNSSLYYHFFCAFTDTRHINPSDVKGFPLDLDAFEPTARKEISRLSKKLTHCFEQNTTQWRKSGLLIDSVDCKPCKPLIDAIDGIVAAAYKITDEELDFIINYDIKYRMGDALEAG